MLPRRDASLEHVLPSRGVGPVVVAIVSVGVVVTALLWPGWSPQSVIEAETASATNFGVSHYRTSPSGLAEPSMGIRSPPQGATIQGSAVTVEVEVLDFMLVPPTDTAGRPGEGHIMYYLDVDLESFVAPDTPAIPPDPNAVFAATDQVAYRFQNVPPGPHDVQVLLVFDNNVPLFPPVADKVTFAVATPPGGVGRPDTPPALEVGPAGGQPLSAQATPRPVDVPFAHVPAAGGPPASRAFGTVLRLIVGATAGLIGLIASVAVVRSRLPRRR